jgi:hypothetical protein
LLPPLIYWLIWVPSCVAFASGVSLLSGRAAWRKISSVVLGLVALAAPLFAPEAPVLRAAAALYLLWSCAKTVEISREPVAREPSFRLLHALVLHDLRRDGFVTHGARPELRVGLLAWVLGAGAVAWAALHVALFEADTLAEPWRWLTRHGAGLAFVYFGVEGALGFFELIYRCCGLKPPKLHDHPILSRSVTEFWGRRWNRVVGSWLFASFYRPLAARGRPHLGTLAAFTASALLHLYFTWVAVGLEHGLTMAAFFVVQVPLMFLEERWEQRRWRSPIRRAWTFGWLCVTSPLFVAPTLAIVAGGFS